MKNRNVGDLLPPPEPDAPIPPGAEVIFDGSHVESCANEHCTNKSNEGRFATFVVADNGLSRRPISIRVCAPCASAIARHLQ